MPLVAANHPNWQSFSNKAGRDVLFINHSYKYKDDKKAQKAFEEILAFDESLAKEGAASYEILVSSDQLDDTKDYSYRNVCFVDYANKEITFATCGTRAGLDQVGADDLYDDALLFFENKPRKTLSASILNEMILDSLGNEATKYKFHFTGHSLGAAVAQVQAVDMDIQLRERGYRNAGDENQISSITFENPGTKTILSRMYKSAGLDENLVDDLNIVVVQNRENMINSLNKQEGRVFEMIPSSQEERKPNLLQSFFATLARLTSFSRVLSKAFGLLSPGGVGIELLKDHSLGNFNETFVQQKGLIKAQKQDVITLEEAYSGLKLVKFDKEIFDNICLLQAAGGQKDSPEIVMQSTDPQGNLLKVSFSYDELDKCLKIMPRKSQEARPKRQNAESFTIKIQQERFNIPTAFEALSSNRGNNR